MSNYPPQNGHGYRCEDREISADLGSEWRWTCTCGARGSWQIQSPDVTYGAWRRHVEKAGPR